MTREASRHGQSGQQARGWSQRSFVYAARLNPVLLLVFMCLMMLVTACHHGTQPDDPQEVTDGFWKEVRQTRHEEDKPSIVAKSTGGELAREDVLQFMENGPAYVLQQVPVEPVLDGNELLGYRVRAFFPADPRFDKVDIEPGDVITAINGRSLERPDHFFAVWESLESTPRVQVDVIRGNTMRTLSWEIVDSVASRETQ